MSGRRGFLISGAASLLVAGVAAPVVARATSPHPDARLLALCGAFHAKQAEAMAFSETVVTDPEMDQLGDILDERWAISDEIEDMTPRTAEGARAMAAVALVLLVENEGEDPASSDVRFTMAALRALAGVSS